MQETGSTRAPTICKVLIVRPGGLYAIPREHGWRTEMVNDLQNGVLGQVIVGQETVLHDVHFRHGVYYGGLADEPYEQL